MKNRRNYISNTIFNWIINKYIRSVHYNVLYLYKLKSIMLRKSNYHMIINKNFLLKYENY